MKRVIVLLGILLTLVGCSHSENSSQSANDKEFCQVVASYLENSAAGNWPEVFNTLTGEALAGAKANYGQVKAGGEKIISKKLKAKPISDSLARVDADLTKNTGAGFDRLGYTFELIRSGDRWLIYKTAWGEYLHDDLKPGQLPADAADVIRTYLEMPYGEKRAQDKVYLSGKLLQDSERSKMLPVAEKAYGELQKTVTTVKSIECLGESDDYLIARAHCEVKGNKPGQVKLLIEAAAVNGAWKLCKIESL